MLRAWGQGRLRSPSEKGEDQRGEREGHSRQEDDADAVADGETQRCMSVTDSLHCTDRAKLVVRRENGNSSSSCSLL